MASRGRKDTDQGIDGDRPAPIRWSLIASGGPEIFDWSGRRGGGDEETRTPDPLLAKETLYQLSYVPSARAGWDGGRFWTRTRDLCLIRAVL